MAKTVTKAEEIDWDAAITGAAVQAVTQTRVRNTRKPKRLPGSSPKPLPPARPVHLLENQITPDSLDNQRSAENLVDGCSLEKLSLGDRGQSTEIWTERELRFLVIYLQGEATIDKAMISAGYTDKSQKARYDIARKLVKRYAAGTEDKANIFRDIGLSEVEVAANIKKLIDKSHSDQVKLNALALAAKCLRLTDEPERTHQGVNINIYTGTQGPGPDGGPPERPTVQVNTQIVHTSKPIQVTK